jgi:parallel beta-helix repeat protein
MALKRLVLVIGFLIASEASAIANTYHVATTGLDTNSGSAAQPWRTLQHAVDSIAPGDTILVAAGTYAGCRIGRSGTPGEVCTLAAATPGSVVISSAGSANRHSSWLEVENFDATVRYWVIDGFEVTGAQRYGIDLRDTDHLTVQNCVVHGSSVTGIFLAFCYNPLIQNNESYSNGEHGIYQSNSGDSPIIRGNRLHHNHAAGLHMNGDRNFTPGDGVISFAVVEKNIVWENGTGGGSGINCDGVSDSVFRNNLLYNNHASGISLYAIDGAQGSSRNRVYNNTIVMSADGRWCVNIPASSEGQSNPVGNIVKNNILYTPHTFRGSISVYSSAPGVLESDYNAVVPRFSSDGGDTNMSLAAWRAFGYDSHSFTTTPDQLFTNPAASDYTLRSGSPAINAGTSLPVDVRDDLAGTLRPQGGSYDVGCYETVSGGGPVAPVADFSGTPLSGTAPLSVQFSDLSSGGVTGWSWDFGDGSTSTQQNPLHVFQNAGSFTVRLTVSSAGGQNTKTRTAYVSVASPIQAPVAEFTAAPLAGTAPLSVQFTDQSTGASSWSWNLGDGSTSAGRNPLHTYFAGGAFTVTLTVSNSAGQATRVRQAYINVSVPTSAPVAEFAATPTMGVAPLSVQFTDLSTGSPAAWLWDFGDGQTSSERNPAHIYTTSGAYTVRLTASNAGGQTTTSRTSYITVQPAATSDYFCASAVVEIGKWRNGTHQSLHQSDDSYLGTKAKFDGGSYSDQISYVFQTGLTSLSTLTITVESRCKTDPPVRQRVFLQNVLTADWELVDDENIVTRQDFTSLVTVQNPSRYLSSNGEVRLRVRTGEVPDHKWKHFIDLVKITAAP